MIPDQASPAPARPRRRWRIAGTAILVWVGVCEALSTMPWIDWDGAPDWLAVPIVMTGFVAVLVLASFIGNAVVAVGFFLLAFRRWRWPLWAALAVSLPYVYVTWRLSPKPW